MPQFRPPAGNLLAPRELHTLRCFLLGVRDPEAVQSLWDEEEAKRKAADPKGKRKKRR